MHTAERTIFMKKNFKHSACVCDDYLMYFNRIVCRKHRKGC